MLADQLFNIYYDKYVDFLQKKKTQQNVVKIYCKIY